MGNESFKATYTSLFSVARRKNATLAEVLITIPLNVAFKRTITGRGVRIVA